MRMTLLKGWEVATGWAALVQALGAAGRKRHEQLTTTTVHVPGQEEPRVSFLSVSNEWWRSESASR